VAARSRLTSALSRRISSASAVVTPGRMPWSTWAWTTQRRSVSRETPNWAPTAKLAAVTEP
jgi:hypothetical protein